MFDELAHDLNRLRADCLYRHLRTVDTAPGPMVRLDGRDVLVFGSNNYLGLATHPEVRRAAAEAAEEWGAGSSGSRLTTGNLALYGDLEREIAAFKGTEAALLFGTGYMAGIGAITALVGDGDLILSDELNHASLIDGCRLSRATVKVYRHCDVEHARELLAQGFSPLARGRRCLVLTDSVFSMDGDIAPLPELQTLCAEYNAWLMIDDAHGTGVLGANGAGTLEHFGLPRDGIIQMGTLSKALGTEGGFIAGSEVLIDYLRNRARSFIFSTAPSPPTVAAARAALRIVQSEPERREQLLANTRQLRAGLSVGQPLLDGSCPTPIVPVILGSAEAATAAAEALLEHGIYVPAIRPPTVPNGTARLRLSVMATHTHEDIDRVIEAMKEIV